MKTIVKLIDEVDRGSTSLIYELLSEKDLKDDKCRTQIQTEIECGNYGALRIILDDLHPSKANRVLMVAAEAFLEISTNPESAKKIILDSHILDNKDKRGNIVTVDEMFVKYVFALASSECGMIDEAIAELNELKSNIEGYHCYGKMSLYYKVCDCLANIHMIKGNFEACLEICDEVIGISDIHPATSVDFMFTKAKIKNIANEERQRDELLKNSYGVAMLFELTTLAKEIEIYAKENGCMF
jgi:hypothetical protein